MHEDEYLHAELLDRHMSTVWLGAPSVQVHLPPHWLAFRLASVRRSILRNTFRSTLKPIALTMALLSFAPMAAAADEALTNKSVIEMVKMGLSEPIITRKIKSGPSAFDTSIASLKALKEAGVSDALIEAMMSASEAQPALGVSGAAATAAAMTPAAAAASQRPAWLPKKTGIYVDRANSVDAPKLERIEPTAYEISKDSGFATSFLSVIKAKTRVRLVGDVSATEVTGSDPTFYFAFDVQTAEKTVPAPATDPMSQAMAMMNQMRGGTEADSPKEYVLVRLESSKNSREFVVGSENAWGSQSGVEDEAVTLLRHEEVAAGIYRVRARKPLAPGQYCFYRVTGNVKASGAFGSRNAVFDFSVR